MAHDADFARAALAAPVRVLGLRLRPYSIGHELFLLREGNSLASLSGAPLPRGADVIDAALICSQTWSELQGMNSDVWLGLKIWLWRLRHRRHLRMGPGWLAAETRRFEAYRRDWCRLPQCGRASDEPGRVMGGPLLSRLIHFLVVHFRKTETEALDYPLGLAQWHYATWKEEEGSLKVLNDDEIELEEWFAEQIAAEGREEEPCRA